MVGAVNEHHHRRSPGYIDVACPVVSDGDSVYHPKRRIEAQRLHDDLSRKLELWNVRVTQRPIAQHNIELLPYLLDTVRTRTQQVEKPRQSVRRGFMAGDQQLHALAYD